MSDFSDYLIRRAAGDAEGQVSAFCLLGQPSLNSGFIPHQPLVPATPPPTCCYKTLLRLSPQGPCMIDRCWDLSQPCFSGLPPTAMLTLAEARRLLRGTGGEKWGGREGKKGGSCLITAIDYQGVAVGLGREAPGPCP